jgi:hypothetical protein
MPPSSAVTERIPDAVCALMAPGQPCAKWQTPPRGVCSRKGGDRVCGECIGDIDAPAIGFRRSRPDDVSTEGYHR